MRRRQRVHANPLTTREMYADRGDSHQMGAVVDGWGIVTETSSIRWGSAHTVFIDRSGAQ
jgi:hypothetical protein